MKNYLQINKMVKLYKNSPSRDDSIVRGLSRISFYSFIYQLYIGNFDDWGFSEKSFLRYFMTSEDKENIPCHIMNDVEYTKKDFIKALEVA